MNTTKKALCFRILTVILTLLIWLIGAAILGFSIYLRVDYWINQYVGASDELMKYTVAVYIFIATGSVIILFGIVGLYGAARPDKWALIVYLVFLPLILCLLIGGGVYGYVYREEIENTVKNSDLLKEVVEKQYGIDKKITNAIDYMQLELKCCGGTSYTDYSFSSWSVNAPEQAAERTKHVPGTCCSDYWQNKDSPEYYKNCRMYTLDSSQSGGFSNKENPFLYRTGCGEAFVTFVQANLGIAAAIALSIVGLLVLAILSTAFLLFYLRKSPLPREDDVVYEMARTQEKSPYPARGGPYANLYQS